MARIWKMMSNAVTLLNILILLGAVISAVLAVTCEKMLSSVLALAAAGTFIALEFLILQAPDVAIAEASVGAVLSTVIFVIAIRKTTRREDEEK